MASIVRDAVINAPADRCWDAVRDFGALHERLARGFVTGLTMTGDRERTITFFTGAVATERLIGIDARSMRLAYTVIDGPLKASHYNASAQVIPMDAASCRFVWAIDVLPDELGSRVGELMDAGLKAIVATLESRETR
jgi:Polyketide cyclase / dehydrase and lipid transport